MKNIKMRVNNNKESACDFCNEKWKNVPEMYDMMLLDNIYTICKHCTSEIFAKILKADCLYDSKLKSSEDLARVRRSDERRNKNMP